MATATSLLAAVSSLVATPSSLAAVIASPWIVAAVPLSGIIEPYRQFVAFTILIAEVFNYLAAELLILLYNFQETLQ